MRQKNDMMEIIESAYVKIFATNGMRGKYWYPYVLNNITLTMPNSSKESEEFILDSGIQKDELTNEEVLETAIELNADYVVPKDYYQDQEKTTESIHEFCDLRDDMGVDFKLIIPLQPPHYEHKKELSGFDYYALGGIKNTSTEEQISQARRFREWVGDDVKIHGFGFGMSWDFIRAIRETPNMLDSIDTSTAERNVVNNYLHDGRLKQMDFQFPNGHRSQVVRASYAQAQMLMLNYLCSPMVDEDEVSLPEQSSALEW